MSAVTNKSTKEVTEVSSFKRYTTDENGQVFVNKGSKKIRKTITTKTRTMRKVIPTEDPEQLLEDE